MSTEQPTQEEQFAEVVERHNHLIRKNQALVNRIADQENTRADYEARAVATVEKLQAENAALREANVPTETGADAVDAEIVPEEDVEVLD